MLVFAAGVVAAMGVFWDVALLDMAGYIPNEGPTISSFPYGVNPVCWLAIGRAGRLRSVPAKATFYPLGLRCARRP